MTAADQIKAEIERVRGKMQTAAQMHMLTTYAELEGREAGLRWALEVVTS